MTLEQLQYPIGKYNQPTVLTEAIINEWIAEISSFPEQLAHAVKTLTDKQLDTAYRPEGWTIRQVVHHCADSHMNSFTRIKLALTDDQPTIKPYYEEQWAELVDSKSMAIAPSLQMLKGIHERWGVLLRNLTDEQYGRIFIHPEHGKTFRVDETIGVYAWHCRHHLAHITEAKKRFDWI